MTTSAKISEHPRAHVPPRPTLWIRIVAWTCIVLAALQLAAGVLALLFLSLVVFGPGNFDLPSAALDVSFGILTLTAPLGLWLLGLVPGFACWLLNLWFLLDGGISLLRRDRAGRTFLLLYAASMLLANVPVCLLNLNGLWLSAAAGLAWPLTLLVRLSLPSVKRQFDGWLLPPTYPWQRLAGTSPDATKNPPGPEGV